MCSATVLAILVYAVGRELLGAPAGLMVLRRDPAAAFTALGPGPAPTEQ
jgi:hypothetical protein